MKKFSIIIGKRVMHDIRCYQSKTTAYHPAGNGQIERMNRTQLSFLISLC